MLSWVFSPLKFSLSPGWIPLRVSSLRVLSPSGELASFDLQSGVDFKVFFTGEPGFYPPRDSEVSRGVGRRLLWGF